MAGLTAILLFISIAADCLLEFRLCSLLINLYLKGGTSAVDEYIDTNIEENIESKVNSTNENGEDKLYCTGED